MQVHGKKGEESMVRRNYGKYKRMLWPILEGIAIFLLVLVVVICHGSRTENKQEVDSRETYVKQQAQKESKALRKEKIQASNLCSFEGTKHKVELLARNPSEIAENDEGENKTIWSHLISQRLIEFLKKPKSKLASEFPRQRTILDEVSMETLYNARQQSLEDSETEIESIEQNEETASEGNTPTETQDEEATALDEDDYPSSDLSATEYTIGDIAKIIDKMNETNGMKVEFTWDEEKFSEDSLFIAYIIDVMERWYEEEKLEAEWTPSPSRFVSDDPYYTEEQGDYKTLANLMYAEEGVLFYRCSFDEAMLAHLFAGTVAMNRAADSKSRFGNDLHDVIYTGSGYPNSTRNRVTNGICDREIVFVLAKMIIQYGPIGPESLIFQSQFEQGLPYARIDNQKFDLERRK